MAIIVPTSGTMKPEASAVRLARYAQRIQYAECAFWGVNSPQNEDFQCREIWLKDERDDIAFYLAEAQREIELELKYFLNPKLTVGNPDETTDPFLVDWQMFDNPHVISRTMQTRWNHLIAPGIRAEQVLEAGALVDHTNDPAEITVLNVSATLDTNEVEVYHAGTEIILTPSAISLSGTTLTIYIPRCRLVDPAYAENPPGGWDYNDPTYFSTTVDVKRIYNDGSVNALLAHQKCCQVASCTEEELSACMYIQDPTIGRITISRANYSNGSWSRAGLGWCCKVPKIARLYYLSGLRALDNQMEDTVIRLAHSKMPTEPCGCDITQRLWERDRTIPDVLTPERLNCPFGINDGAWIAWRFTNRRRVIRTKVL
jgi:hypothetical protein